MEQEEQLELARKLVSHLETDQQDQADELLLQLSKARDIGLYQEVGKLTRELHDSLSTVNRDSTIADMTEVDIPDAKDRLNYVIEKTADSANKTLAAVETVMPLLDTLSEKSSALHEEWQRLVQRDLDKSEYKVLSESISSYFDDVQTTCTEANTQLTNILMAQDFQDLTGQVIKRVIDLVQNVENKLVSLVSAVGTQNDVKENTDGADIKAEGPQIHPEDRDDVVHGQDEVDDLLSSLGF